jgi:hypothetical protein
MELSPGKLAHLSARPDGRLSGTYSCRLWDTEKSRCSTVQLVVAALLLFRHEGKFGVAFDDGGVEGGELVASLMLACADQQFVGQVGTATQGTDGLSNSIFVFKPKVVNLQKTRKRVGDLAVSPVIETGQHPVSLDKYEISDEEYR